MVLVRVRPCMIAMVLILLGCVVALTPSHVAAASFTVTDCTDNAADPGSLRFAVNNLATGAASNTNTIAITANCPSSSPLTLTNGTLILAQGVTITGPGASQFAIDGGCTDCGVAGANTSATGSTIVSVNASITASISGITLTHGRATVSVGGTDFGGGSVAMKGSLSVTGCVFVDNSASYGGAIAIVSPSGNLVLANSSFRGNVASKGGGAISIGIGDASSGSTGGSATVTNSTFTGNKGQFGGAILSIVSGSTSLQSVTISGNTTTDTSMINGSGAVATPISFGGPLILANSIIAGNTGATADYYIPNGGTTTDNGHNLIGTASGATFTASGDKVGVPALLGPPGVYGAANGTETQPPLPGSPAIDAGGSGCPATDQRGITRPIGAACDIGAFESQGFTFSSPSGNGQSAATGQSFPSPLGLTISDMNGEPVNDGSVTFTITPGLGGASATFPAAGGCTLSMSNTVAVCPVTGSGASGTGTSPTFTANGVLGSFTIVASTAGVLASGNVTFTETIVNTAPTLVQPANITILEDAGAQSVMLTGIGQGASDTGQTLTVTATSDTPTVVPNPTLIYTSPNSTATLAFTPAANANTPTTPVTITVTVKDNGGTANGGMDTTIETFTVTVTPVNDAPSFVKGADVTVSPNSGAYAQPFATAISPGPPDESAQTLAFTVTMNTNAALFAVAPTVSPAGVLSFTPAMNALGNATLTLVLKDNGGTANGGVDTSAPQTFTITVSGNAPTAAPDSYTLITGTTLTVPAATGVLANDTRGTPAATITANTQPTHGTLTFTRADGSFTYVPTAPYVGTDSFTYTLSNGNGSNGTGSSTATVTLTVTAATLQSLSTTAPTGSGNSGSATAPILRVGASIILATVGTYTNGTTGSVSGLTYSGYNPNIVNVDANGVVTAIAGGTTTITITGPGGVTTTITVTVTSATGGGLMNPNAQPMARATAGATGTPQAQPNRAPMGNGSRVQPQGASGTGTPSASPTPEPQPVRR